MMCPSSSRTTCAIFSGEPDSPGVRQTGHTGCKVSKWRTLTPFQPPMMTVGHPGGMIFPVGDGMGATHDMWAVMSPTRAAGRPPIFTVEDAFAIIPGPAGTQEGNMQGLVVSSNRAAILPPIMTVGSPLMIARGSAG